MDNASISSKKHVICVNVPNMNKVKFLKSRALGSSGEKLEIMDLLHWINDLIYVYIFIPSSYT